MISVCNDLIDYNYNYNDINIAIDRIFFRFFCLLGNKMVSSFLSEIDGSFNGLATVKFRVNFYFMEIKKIGIFWDIFEMS